MGQLWEQWDELDDRARAPYEARAANDANRYRREVLFTILSMSRRHTLAYKSTRARREHKLRQVRCIIALW